MMEQDGIGWYIMEQDGTEASHTEVYLKCQLRTGWCQLMERGTGQDSIKSQKWDGTYG